MVFICAYFSTIPRGRERRGFVSLFSYVNVALARAFCCWRLCLPETGPLCGVVPILIFYTIYAPVEVQVSLSIEYR